MAEEPLEHRGKQVQNSLFSHSAQCAPQQGSLVWMGRGRVGLRGGGGGGKVVFPPKSFTKTVCFHCPGHCTPHPFVLAVMGTTAYVSPAGAGATMPPYTCRFDLETKANAILTSELSQTWMSASCGDFMP